MKDDVLSMQIEQARNGDEQAIAGLIARQMPQIRSLAAKAVRPGLDFDDAVQEGITNNAGVVVEEASKLTL